MNIYLDCFSGIAGDMYLAALLDLGLDISALRDFFTPLGIPQLELDSRRVIKRGIDSAFLEVRVGGADSESGHHHHHHHHHGHTFVDIRSYLHRQPIAPELIERAERVFRFIAEAESTVHGKPVDELHFHEVGQWDAIVDVLGVLWGLQQLGVKEIFCSAVNVGGGFVEFSHGRYPVPAPATANILKSAQIPFFTTPDAGEMLTPTGAALLAETVTQFSTPGTLRADKIAYGAGSREHGTIPNVVRLVSFEQQDIAANQVVVIETNLDDMNPEFCEYVIDRLMENGAYDVFLTPVIMKKSRPAVKLTVIASLEKRPVLTKTIMEETTTFGLRWSVMDREVLQREIRTVPTPYGEVKVKYGSGTATKAVPEYQDCLRVAREKSVPLWKVYQAAQRACD